MATSAITLTAVDGVRLEAELARPVDPARAGVVLCHPHPSFGGTMRSIVISALFAALPTAGVTAIRFNFRGVEHSDGAYDEGRGEALDARAALAELRGDLGGVDPVPTFMLGWSFGGGVALGVDDDRLAGWIGIAPALHFGVTAGTGRDPRPKLVVIGDHDRIVSPATVREEIRNWTNTELVSVPGADHFFIGRTDRVVALVTEFVDRSLDAIEELPAGPH